MEDAATDDLKARQFAQQNRIDHAVAKILGLREHLIRYVFSECGVSFRIAGPAGETILESNSPMLISEIEQLSDDDIEIRLRKRLEATAGFYAR